MQQQSQDSKRNTQTNVPTILVIEDNPDDLRVLSNYIGDLGKIVFAGTGTEGMAMAEKVKPDLILLDIELPDILGPAVFKNLQSQGDETAVIFVTSHSSAMHQIAALESGAADFISKPFQAEVIRQSVQGQLLKQVNRKAKLAKNRDRITNAYNRAYFDAFLDMTWRAQASQSSSITLALVQIDHFEDYNEGFGNLLADACLKKVAKALSEPYLSVSLQPARYASDKFALVFPGLGAELVKELGHQLVERVHNLAIARSHSDPLDLMTASVGISTCIPRPGQNCSSLREGAYNALTQAREAGRNQFALVKI